MAHIIGFGRRTRETYPRRLPPGSSGPQGPGGGLVSWGSASVPTGAGVYKLAPWNEDAIAQAGAFAWSSGCPLILACLAVRHNVLGAAAEDITYELFINGGATGLAVILPANSAYGTTPLPNVAVAPSDEVELRVTHAGLTSSPQRIIATATVGDGDDIFGIDYQRVDSAGLFVTGAGMGSPTAFVTKPGASLITPALTGTYRVGWHALVNTTAANVNSATRLFNATDAVIVGSSPQRFEPSSSSQEIEDVNGANNVVFTGAAKTFQIEVRKFSGPNPGAVGIQDAWIELWRVA